MIFNFALQEYCDFHAKSGLRTARGVLSTRRSPEEITNKKQQNIILRIYLDLNLKNKTEVSHQLVSLLPSGLSKQYLCITMI